MECRCNATATLQLYLTCHTNLYKCLLVLKARHKTLTLENRYFSPQGCPNAEGHTLSKDLHSHHILRRWFPRQAMRTPNVLHKPAVHMSAVRSAAALVLHRLMLAPHMSAQLVPHRLLRIEHSAALVLHRFALAPHTEQQVQRMSVRAQHRSQVGAEPQAARSSELVPHDEQQALRMWSQAPHTEQQVQRMSERAQHRSQVGAEPQAARSSELVLRTWSQAPHTE